MSRIALFSDIHANYHALQAALTLMRDVKVDDLWVLGDTLGYGPLHCGLRLRYLPWALQWRNLGRQNPAADATAATVADKGCMNERQV